MVNKLLIGFGVAVLVAVGSLGAWKLSGTERQRTARWDRSRSRSR